MDIRTSDIIKLSDGNEYIVVSKVSYQNSEYIYLVDLKNNTNIKFAEIEKDCISELDSNNDKNLIEILILLFYTSAKDNL